MAKFIFGSTVKLQKPDFEKDVVYLVQFPRAHCAPSISPYCLKLETWLRMNDIKYENINNNFSVFSSRGQLPYVELNGEEIPDSKLAIEVLSKHFDKHLDEGISEADASVARAFECLIEDALFWKLLQWRSCDVYERMFNKEVMLDNPVPTIIRMVRPLAAYKFAGYLRDRCDKQGTGKYTSEELTEMGKRDLKALDTFFASRQFMAGDKPTSFDTTAFGHLVQLYYTPPSSKWALRDYIENDCGNIRAYLERMRARYWPDWQKACDDLDLDSHLPDKAEGVPAADK